MPRWKHEQVHPAITRVSCELKNPDDSLWFLLRGDAHHDNPHSDHDLQREHLEEAVRRDACIIDVGDLFCAMGGKADPRMMKRGTMREEHSQANDYFDSLVRHNAQFIRPYARQFAVIAQGNHETAVLKRQETCLTTRLIERLNTAEGTAIVNGGYGGWVHIHLTQQKRNIGIWVKYFHGSGGGGLMSFDTLRVRRIASFVNGADVVVSGHVHERWALEIAQEQPTAANGCYDLRHRSQWHVRTGTYKDEYRDGRGGWHIERGAPPKPLGAYWMRVGMGRKRIDGIERLRPRIELVAT